MQPVYHIVAAHGNPLTGQVVVFLDHHRLGRSFYPMTCVAHIIRRPHAEGIGVAQFAVIGILGQGRVALPANPVAVVDLDFHIVPPDARSRFLRRPLHRDVGRGRAFGDGDCLLKNDRVTVGEI